VPIPRVGDIVQIKPSLTGCHDTNWHMEGYAGRTARVVSVRSEVIRTYVGTINFTVRLDIDDSRWTWYEDGLILITNEPGAVFRC
jgi:hypothetical protein